MNSNNDVVEPSAERQPLLPKSGQVHSATRSCDSESSSSSSITQQSRSVSRLQGILICFCVYLQLFIVTCNITCITTIQSSIATDLNSYDNTSWFSSIYLIGLTSLTPAAGRFCTIFAPRNVLVVCAFSAACGLLVTSQAQSFGVFLLGRVITGAAAGTISPVAFILINELASIKRRSTFFGLMSAGYTSGVACGAIIAGALEPHVGWRAIFWMQIPILAVAALSSFLVIPLPAKDLDMPTSITSTRQKLSRIDYPGLVFIIATVAFLLYGLSAARIRIIPLILSLVSLIVFLLIEFFWAREPIIPPVMLKSKGNMLAGFAVMGIQMSRWSVLLYTPVFGIAMRDWSATVSGTAILPANIGFALGGIIVGAFHIRRTGSFYLPVLLMIALFACVQFMAAPLITPTSNIHGYLVALLANGLLAGATLNYALAHTLHLSPVETHTTVFPIHAMFRGLSGSVGSAFGGGVFLRSLRTSLEDGYRMIGPDEDRSELIHKLLGSPALVHQLTGIEHEIAVQGYQTALQHVFLFAAILALCMIPLMAGTGWTAPSEDEKARVVLSEEDVLNVHENEQNTGNR